MQKLTPEQIRKKYFNVVHAAGIDKALTLLHNELGALEARLYDGGFKKERLEHLQFMRNLAREVYDYTLELDAKALGKK